LNNFIIYVNDDEWKYEKRFEEDFDGGFVELAPATMDGGSCPNQCGSAAHWPEPCFNKTVLTLSTLIFAFSHLITQLSLYLLFLNIWV